MGLDHISTAATSKSHITAKMTKRRITDALFIGFAFRTEAAGVAPQRKISKISLYPVIFN